MLEFYNQSFPKAKKEYICDLCNEKIAIGEKYSRFSGKYDGDMLDIKHHLACKRIVDTYCEKVGEGEYTNDYVQGWLREEYCYSCENYEECTEYEMQCPLIRKSFEKGGVYNADT